MNTTAPVRPPRGGGRRNRNKAGHYSNVVDDYNTQPHLTQASSDTSSSQSRSPPSKQQQPSDRKIRRGAAIIRQQIRQKLEQETKKKKKKKNDTSTDTSFMSEEWSDPWAGEEPPQLHNNKNTRAARVVPARRLLSAKSQRLARATEAEDPAANKQQNWSYQKEQEEDAASFSRFPAEGDASEWVYMSDSSSASSILLNPPSPRQRRTTADIPSSPPPEHLPRRRPPAPLPPTPPPPPELADDATPETYMGRGRRIRAKVVTYLVQPLEDMEASSLGTFDDGTDSERINYLPQHFQPEVRMEPTPEFRKAFQLDVVDTLPTEPMEEDSLKGRPLLRDPFNMRVSKSEDSDDISSEKSPYQHDWSSDCADSVPSPVTAEYSLLMHDPAYCHAQKAGHLWQSLVGQHVRFPSRWWNGERGPPMGIRERRLWEYVAHHRVQSNSLFRQVVRNRGSPGRILLHVVVRDLMTWRPVRDIAIGCYHPNARFVRMSQNADPKLENCRDVWMAVRQRTDAVSVIDHLFVQQNVNHEPHQSPIGTKHSVNNHNMRAVFGDQPPMRTIFILESELYERIMVQGKSPALTLLQEFLFR